MGIRAALLLVLASLAIAAPAQGATLVVTKSGDSLDGLCGTDCSLREAVVAANATGVEDEILLPAGIVRLTLFGVEDANAKGDIDVTADLTIRGFGPVATTIQSAVDDRVLDLHNASADLHLLDLTVSGGRALSPDDRGGGIRSQATGELSLERVVVRDNLAQGAASFGYGGGIYKATGKLTLRDSAILGNRATGPGYGGGLFVQIPTTSAELTNVTIAENYAGNQGGGLYSNNSIPATFTHVTVVGNEAGFSSGAFGGDAAAFHLRSSIVAANLAPTFPDCGATFFPISDGGNVGAAACGLSQASDVLAADPGLGPLSGATVPVREPLPGSPALDRAVGPCPPADARGVPRPQGVACDAGAAELPVAIVPAVTPTATPTARLGKLSKRLLLRRGKILVPLRCLADARCAGNLRLTLVKRSKKRASAQAVVVLGRKRFSVGAGKRATVRVPLSAVGRRAVKGHRATRARLTVRLAGVSAARKAAVRVVRPRPKRRGAGS
jgi:CSLREA domain-containing protein